MDFFNNIKTSFSNRPATINNGIQIAENSENDKFAAGKNALNQVRDAFQTPCCKSALPGVVLDAIIKCFDILDDQDRLKAAIVVYIESKKDSAGLGCFASPSNEEITDALNEVKARLSTDRSKDLITLYQKLDIGYLLTDEVNSYNEKPIVRSQDAIVIHEKQSPFSILPKDLHYPITNNLSLLDHICFALTNKYNFIMNCADATFWKSTLNLKPEHSGMNPSKWLFLNREDLRLEEHALYGKKGDSHLIKELFCPPTSVIGSNSLKFCQTDKPQIFSKEMTTGKVSQAQGETPLALIKQKILNNEMTINDAKEEIGTFCYWLQYERISRTSYGAYILFSDLHTDKGALLFAQLYYQGKVKIEDLKDSERAINLILKNQWIKENFEAGKISIDQLRKLPPVDGTDAAKDSWVHNLIDQDMLKMAEFFDQIGVTEYNVLSCKEFQACFDNDKINIYDVINSSDNVKEALINLSVLERIKNKEITMTQVINASEKELAMLKEKNGTQKFVEELNSILPSFLRW